MDMENCSIADMDSFQSNLELRVKFCKPFLAQANRLCSYFIQVTVIKTSP